ncbi:hypothetical protein RHGRI_007797 [Rhododendron griersonianum]|uniref:Uncharacterized protein n=1 Tax=Rhododendron griersonianum TaxID=479676 RepID=A0AAV6L047_9ERIC|nr:hypothetical protein RHGRI_007797 [Rhododendron griersonianum]
MAKKTNAEKNVALENPSIAIKIDPPSSTTQLCSTLTLPRSQLLSPPTTTTTHFLALRTTFSSLSSRCRLCSSTTMGDAYRHLPSGASPYRLITLFVRLVAHIINQNHGHSHG